MRMARRVIGQADTARRTSWTTSRASGVGKRRQTGPRRTRIGWKWSPSRLKPSPLIGTIGAWKWA